jgi:cyclopropane-fatty-acyl-phospholipid synthase
MMRRFVRVGTINIIDAEGVRHRFSGAPGPEVTVRLSHAAPCVKIALNPHLGAGEAYMDGTLTVEDGSLRDFLKLVFINLNYFDSSAQERVIRRLGQIWDFMARNGIERSRRNIIHHYDLSNDFYKLFLDKDMQYSCALFDEKGTITLDEAQLRKRRHIIGKLCLKPGMKVLDIGCGWGGLAIEMAKRHGAEVVGVTLSGQQHELGRQRVRQAGLESRVDLRLQDYREVTGRFDRIVSVGMFEHVGKAHFPEYFRKCRALLQDDGVMLLHAIGVGKPLGSSNPWLKKYIFPGGFLPALSEVTPEMEKADLRIADIEVLRLHYAYTLREWHARCEAHKDRIVRMFGARFYRMWEMYLLSCEAGFLYGGLAVFQTQLVKQVGAVPITRDYLYRPNDLRPHLTLVSDRPRGAGVPA